MISSTVAQIEEFKSSLIWADIKAELFELAKRAQLEYDLVGEPRLDDDGSKLIPNEAETLIHLGDIKGRRKAVSYFLDIPNILIQLAEDQKQTNNTDQEVSNG